LVLKTLCNLRAYCVNWWFVSLQQWFPEVELAPDSEFKLEDREKTPPTSSNTDKDFENIEITRKISIDSVEPNQTSIENITITRKVSLIPMVRDKFIRGGFLILISRWVMRTNVNTGSWRNCR